jgi:hypothetical protein
MRVLPSIEISPDASSPAILFSPAVNSSSFGLDCSVVLILAAAEAKASRNPIAAAGEEEVGEFEGEALLLDVLPSLLLFDTSLYVQLMPLLAQSVH